MPNSCLDQRAIRQNHSLQSRSGFESYHVTGVLLQIDRAVHHLLGNLLFSGGDCSRLQCWTAEAKSTVSHNNDTITFMKEQIIPESKTKKVLSQDHLNNYLDFSKLVCGMINTLKNTTMTKYLMGQIPEVFLQLRQIH